MYFPVIVSALQIPRFQNPIQKIVNKNKAVIDDCLFEGDSYKKISELGFKLHYSIKYFLLKILYVN